MRGLPRRRASTAWPSALLSLCAPVCRRSSRFRYRRVPGRKRSASVSGVGRPAYSRPSAVELGCEGRVGRCLVPAGLQLVERRDERLRDEAPAVLAEPAVACRLGHVRAASTNARTRSWSLIPGADSRLELASTAHGRTAQSSRRRSPGSIPPPASAAPLQPARDRGESGSSSAHGRSIDRRDGNTGAQQHRRRDPGLCPPRARTAGRGRRRSPPPLRPAQRRRARCRRRRAPPRPPAGSPA